MSKIECNIGPRKIIEKVTHLGPKMVPKLIKIELENPENHQNCQKTIFLRGQFFDDFLDGKKIEKRRYAHLRVTYEGAIGGSLGSSGG